MALRMKRRAGSIGLVIGLLIAAGNESMARDFRTSMMPNGNVFSCNTCHIIPGGPRNEFGLDVEKLVTPGGRQQFWNAELAAKDSDGDGISNGAELLDPAGVWKSGDPDPGTAKDVTNPGDITSFNQPVIKEGGESYVCELSGASVVPPVETQARGVAVLELYAPEKELVYYLNVFETGSITAAYIHLGEPTENGGILYPLDTPAEGASMGTLSLTDEDIANLQGGKFYVQIHTLLYSSGEIRGQAKPEAALFSADLDGTQVVPPNNSPGTGVARISLSTDLKKLRYTVEVSGLTGVTAAHFHVGARGESGGVVIPIVSGSFTQIDGEADMTPDVLAGLFAEKLYINIHTSTFLAGEIRGQVQWKTEEAESSGVLNWNLYP